MPQDRDALSELSIGGRWGFQEAQARFGELVERARTEGPQEVTVQDAAVVVIAADQLERMLRPGSDSLPLVDFMESLGLADLDLERDRDLGRDVSL